jgi:two-component system, sensor histidine kinase and response regulator
VSDTGPDFIGSPGIGPLSGGSARRLARLWAASRLMDDASRQANTALFGLVARAGERMRRPLQELMAALERLARADLESASANVLASARASTDTMVGAVDDLLSVIAIRTGELAIEATDFDLRTLVEDVCSGLADSARSKRLELFSVVSDDLPAIVTGDPTHIQRTLTTLADNAIRFTDTGDVMVRVEARAVAVDPSGDNERGEAGFLYRFEICDTGARIAPEAVARLFEGLPDLTGSNGPGLGLAIAQGLVHAMHGEIGVGSDAGPGTRFWFELPLPGRSPSEDAVRKASAALAGRRILVAQSNDRGRRQLLDQLAAWRVEAHGEPTAAAALRAIRTEADGPRAFDAVLIDTALPDIDGNTLARLIRRDPSIGEIPIVLLIDSAVPADANGSAVGRAYVEKPVRRAALCHVLCEVLDPARRDATPHRAATTVDMPGAEPGMRILLVEDYDVNLEVALAIIRKANYDVTVARNGAEAIERFVADGPFDAVVMDCMMPVMDGYAAAIRIRGIEQETGAARTPIIALTAAALKEDRDRCFASGMDEYLTKPVRGHELRAVLIRWTTDRSRVATAAGGDAAAGDGIIDESAIAALRSLRSRNIDVLGPLIEAYIRDTPLKCAALRDAAGRGDFRAFRRVIQTMKSASRTLGALRVSDLCHRVDVDAGTDPISAMQPGRIDELVAECQEAMRRLTGIEGRGEACPIV